VDIGLIGCGRVAAWHTKIYKLIKNAKVVAVTDVSEERARAFARENKIDKYFKNHLDILEMKNLDFVDICTPTSTHAPITIDAIKSGHNVLLEKPFALNVQECDKIISENQKHKVKVCICHNQIYFPNVQKIKSMIDSNIIEPVTVKTFIKANGELLPSWTTTISEGGVLWESGYHSAYLQLFFLTEIKDVFATGSKMKFPVYDDFCVLLRTTSQCYGIIEISMLSKKQEVFYEIDTSDGMRFQLDVAHDYLIKAPAKVTELARVWAKYKLSREKLRYFRGHFYLICSFMSSLTKDLPSPVPPEEGKKTIQLLECIQKSLDGGKIVSVPS
jgi:predicted dehydrogenase